MQTRISRSGMMAVVVMLLFILSASYGTSQTSDLYKQGSVWELTFVKLKPHSGEQYLEGLKKTWKSSMDELQTANLIKSYKILWGDAANPEDFDMLLMIEYENLAALDPNPERDKKIDEIEKKIKDSMGDDYMKTVEGYTNLRELMGSKTMREIKLN